MTFPNLTMTVKNKSLGLGKGSTDHLAIILGTCSAGVVKQRYSFTDIQSVQDKLGLGPLSDMVAYALQNAGGPVLAMPVNASVVGAAAVDSGAHAGDGTVVVKNGTTPVDAFTVLVTITKAGLLGAAQFSYSLDGGLTTEKSGVVVPAGADYVLGDSGLTLTFAVGAGGFNKGDTFKFVCTAPGFAQGDVTDAVDAAIALADDFSLLYVTGEMDTAAHAEAMAAAVDAKLVAAAQTKYRYITGFIDCPWDAVTNNDAAVIAAVVNADLEFTSFGAGHFTLTSAINGRQLVRNVQFGAVARAILVDIQEDLGRFATGPVPNVAALDRDEYKTVGLDAARVLTARTYPGQTGFYITQGMMLAAQGSDFSLVQYRRVMNKACAITRDTLMSFLNETLAVNANGTLTEKQARLIESTVARAIESGIVNKGASGGVTVTIDRTENVLTSQNITVTVQLNALGYAKTITVTLGFTNPSLVAA